MNKYTFYILDFIGHNVQSYQRFIRHEQNGKILAEAFSSMIKSVVTSCYDLLNEICVEIFCANNKVRTKYERLQREFQEE